MNLLSFMVRLPVLVACLVCVVLPLGLLASILLGLGMAGKWVSTKLATFTRWMQRFSALILIMAMFGCAAGSWFAGKAHSKDESFAYWTRFYETRMGLVEGPIRFGETPHGNCGEVAWEIMSTAEGAAVPVAVTYYDQEVCSPKEPWKVALHEACHRRYMHHVASVQKALQREGRDMEDEAKHCESLYEAQGLRP